MGSPSGLKNENGHTKKFSWQQLCDHVSVVQQWLAQNGVGEGDVVAGYLPHLPETVIAMLAATSLGAIWTSTSPDFGVESVIERFGQVQPKFCFVVMATRLTVNRFPCKSVMLR